MRIAALMTRIMCLVRGDRGATSVEYALLITLIALVIIGVVMLVGTHLSDMFDNAQSALP